jgi:hypothetical protein
MVGEEVTQEMTGNCSLGCSQCINNCTPKGYVPPVEEVLAELSHLPKAMLFYTISGGEPLGSKKSKDLTFAALEYIQDNRENQMPNLEVIRIFTNGLWLTDERRAYETIELLEYYDVSVVEVSFDMHHKRAAEKLLGYYPLSLPLLAERATAVGEIYEGKILLLPFGGKWELDDYKADPFGRARSLPLSEIELCPDCELSFGNLKKIVIAPKGDVYLCGEKIPHTSLGSAIKEPIDDLVERALKNPIFSALISGGPRKVAGVTEVDIPDGDGIPCGADACIDCERLFSELNDKGII